MLIIAHRGASKYLLPENSFNSFKHSLEHGVKAIELDVRFNYWNGTMFLAHDIIHRRWRKKHLLDMILESLPSDAIIFLEMKTLTISRDLFTRQLIELINRYNKADQVLIMSYNLFALWQLRKLNYPGKIGYLIGSELIFKLTKKWLASTLKPDALMISKRLINQEKIAFAKQCKAKIFMHVANTHPEWQYAKKHHLDGIITDYPLNLQTYLSENG